MSRRERDAHIVLIARGEARGLGNTDPLGNHAHHITVVA